MFSQKQRIEVTIVTGYHALTDKLVPVSIAFIFLLLYFQDLIVISSVLSLSYCVLGTLYHSQPLCY